MLLHRKELIRPVSIGKLTRASARFCLNNSVGLLVN